MSFADLDAAAARPGELGCVCGSAASPQDFAGEAWRLATAFALAVFAQATAAATFALAGRYLAPQPALATLPFAASFAGAVCASFPASLLLDRFGRQAAFAAGASLGVAGGVLASHALLARQFPEWCVGAFWLGAAFGVAMFYRCAAAIGGAGGSRPALAVLTGGAGGALLAPHAIGASRALLGPRAEFAGPALAAAANLLALPLVLSLPHRLAEAESAAVRRGADAGYVLALSSGALGWFAMTEAMAGAPSLMIDCGLGAESFVGAEGAHMLAMYARIAVASAWPGAIPTRAALLAGAALALLSLAGRALQALPALETLGCAATG